MLCGVLAVALLAAGCQNRQREATEAAISAAETALATVQTEAEKYVPDQLKAAQAALQSGKDALARDDYSKALAGAHDAANRAKELVVAAATKKEEWTKAWASMNESIPKRLNEAKRRLDAYSHGARLPSGMDQEVLEGAKRQYEQLKQTWEDASSSATQGRLGEAMKKAAGMEEALEQLMETLGMKPKKVGQ
ncbi:MAG TPA: hypothetical protein VEI54_10660 [Candidatus Limnocylindrales bacterium]|nr:hypothetical protein [Candidatus Limnocylindrales bacterium]